MIRIESFVTINRYLFYSQKFNAYLKDDKNDRPQPVIRILEKVNDHLRAEETRFMVTDELRRADCHLLPWLQHIRVAGKVRNP